MNPWLGNMATSLTMNDKEELFMSQQQLVSVEPAISFMNTDH